MASADSSEVGIAHDVIAELLEEIHADAID
jgi:hypothetical protein